MLTADIDRLLNEKKDEALFAGDGPGGGGGGGIKARDAGEGPVGVGGSEASGVDTAGCDCV